MDERALRFRVGVVVVAAAMITVILITLLGAWPSPFKARYPVYIVFPEAPGVTVDTPVRKSGVQIGRVANVELREQGGVLLTLRIDEEFPLRQNEVARITTGSLVTGDAVLEFVSSDDPQLSDRMISPGEYMAEGEVVASPFEVLANLEGEIGDAVGTIRQAGSDVSTLATNMNDVLQGNRERLVDILRKTDVALDQITRTVNTIESVLGDEELAQQLRQTLEDLPKLFADAQDTLAKTRETLDGFGRVSVRAERNLANLEDFTAPLGERGEEIAENLVDTVRNVDRLLANLVQLSESLTSRKGTLGELIHNRELYDRLNRVAAELENSIRRVRPILEDLRVATDKIARDPRQLGVRGALERRPSGAGLKLPLR